MADSNFSFGNSGCEALGKLFHLWEQQLHGKMWGFPSQMHFVAQSNSLGWNSNWAQSIKFIEVAGLSYKI